MLVSGIFGWVMLCAIVLAMPDLDTAAQQGDRVVVWTISSVLPPAFAALLFVGIAMAQYLCGLATVTSASRVMFAFARDGGLPFSTKIRQVSPTRQVPVTAIWLTCMLAIAFTLYTPVYSTITSVSVIFLYLSYLMPTVLGLRADGRTWTTFGPWTVGVHYRWMACVCVVGIALLLVIGVQPPNGKALGIIVGAAVLAAVTWYGGERRRFVGPPAVKPPAA